MKKFYILIAIAMVAVLTLAGCKNNNSKKQSQEPTQKEIQAQKQALADSVLAKIDELAEEYFIFADQSFSLTKVELTDAEKMVKPNYLLDPSEANKLISRSQKINGLAIYSCETVIRMIYGMPTEESKEAIARLTAEINYPIDFSGDVPRSELLRKQYESFKQNDDLATFWQFQNAMLVELSYVIANNPELFFSRITEEQYHAFSSRIISIMRTLEVLAPYDSDAASILQWRNDNRIIKSDGELSKVISSVQTVKEFRIANKDKYISKRNALLQ